MKELKKAVIPAAGLGTRFLPITKAIPKPMLPVVDKPTVQYIVEELKTIGIEDVLIVVSPNSNVIKKHFEKSESLEKRLLEDGKTELLEIAKETSRFNVSFVEQKVANGLAGAILCAKEFVGDDPFVLLLGDEMLYNESGDSCLKKLTECYKKTGKSVLSAMTVFGNDVEKYGNIGVGEDFDDYFTVSGIVEKPSLCEALSNYAIIGRYVIAGGVINRIEKLKPKGSEIMFTDVLDDLAKENLLIATTFNDERFDVGDKLGYIKANLSLGLKRKEFKDDLADFIKDLAKKL